jgi:hypothetical protein
MKILLVCSPNRLSRSVPYSVFDSLISRHKIWRGSACGYKVIFVIRYLYVLESWGNFHNVICVRHPMALIFTKPNRYQLWKILFRLQDRAARFDWPHEHKHWMEAQWDRILWTDETWVNPGRQRETWTPES